MSARILLVDDEQGILDAVGYTLRQEGFEVVTATDGETALQLARGRPFDVVVLDVMMPGMSGMDVCRILRAESAVPRTPVIAGNWKMHTTLAEARTLAAAVRDGCRGLAEIRVAVCPPFTALSAVAEVLAGSPVLLGAQDAHWEMTGAFTGCVSPAQVWDAGARVVILGHSERRHGLGETDEVVRRKVTAALKQGLTPLVCVGETAEERAADRTLEVVALEVPTADVDRDRHPHHLLDPGPAGRGREVRRTHRLAWSIADWSDWR